MLTEKNLVAISVHYTDKKKSQISGRLRLTKEQRRLCYDLLVTQQELQILKLAASI